MGLGIVALLVGLIPGNFWLGAGAIGLLAISGLAYWLEQRKWVLTGRIIFSGLTFGLVTLAFIGLGTYSAAAFFYSWALLVALLLLGPEVALGLTLANTSLLLVLFGLERFTNLYRPLLRLDVLGDNLLTLAGIIVLIGSSGAGYLHLSRRLLISQIAIRQQADELAEILGQQARSRTTYQVLGHEVSATAGQLSLTSEEQATVAAQQVSAIVQVAVSMQELSQTAAQIAERSRMVQQTTSEVSRSALEVAATTVQVSQSSARGQQSVAQTASSNQTMRTAYQSLNASLQQLSERSIRIQEILSLIETIADETHLLSLNATIEAAGAGEHGERFGVVAQQVKDLANRARRASGQVRQVVVEVDTALKMAHSEATKGGSVAEQAAQSAQESAQVIAELEDVVKKAAAEAAEIALNAGRMEEIASEIGFATHLQQNASEQVLTSLLTVQNTAEVNALSSSQIATDTTRLQELASRFNAGSDLNHTGDVN